MTQGRILTVAESDSSGGSGIQADIKTVTALGGYAASAITALTAQNSLGVRDFMTLDPGFAAEQMRVVIDDLGVDAIKTGVLGNEAIINAVADVLDELQGTGIIVVVDPAIVDRKLQPLLPMDAIAALKRRLLVRATVITPNRAEAELLTGMVIRDLDAMRHAADMLRTLGAEAVILKGGQIADARVVDLVATGDGEQIFETEMVDCRHTHGAGCTLASAVAVGLAQGLAIADAMKRALDYLSAAIRTAPGFGEGVGPVNHACYIDSSRNRRVAA